MVKLFPRTLTCDQFYLIKVKPPKLTPFDARKKRETIKQTDVKCI